MSPAKPKATKTTTKAKAVKKTAARTVDSTELSPSIAIEQALGNAGLLHSARPARVVVAVSGGIDSMALLYATQKLRKNHPHLQVFAAGIDHGWRPAPLPELDPIWQQCQQWQVPVMTSLLSRGLAKTETVARQARYSALEAIAEHIDAHAILTAHHADDQIETLLMRVLRGTGVQGLSGIPAQRLLDDSQVPVLRPWLKLTKGDLLAYAESNQLRWHDDETNNDTRHVRNSLRKEVIPYLEKSFPNTRQALSRLATLASEEQDMLEALITPYWHGLFDGQQLNLITLNQLAKPLKKNLLVRFLQHYQLPINYDTIDRVLAFVEGSDKTQASAQRLSIESPDDTADSHWHLAINQHTLRVVANDAATMGLANSDADEDALSPDPVAFRLPQLFPTWAGVGPAAASDDDDKTDTDAIRNESIINDADDDEDDTDAYSDADATLDADIGDDAELDDLADDSIDEADDDELDSGDLETDGEAEAPTSAIGGASSESDDDKSDVGSPGKLIETPALHQSRSQFIALPDYNAELEITRLGPDEVIPEPLPNPTENIIYANLKLLINDTLSIRTRRSGDRIHPLGMMNAMRLKNYFINRGIPQEDRATIPLLTTGSDVLWAVGIGFSELFRIEKRPTHRLTWRTIEPGSSDSALPTTP